jgi:membrane-bound lytic murein transglycosylase MltF
MRIAAVIVLAALYAAGCSGPENQTETAPGRAEANTAAAGETAELRSSFTSGEPFFEPWTGDLDGMAKRGYIRALVAYSKTNYFLDGATQRGVTYEALVEFENYLNTKLGTKTVRVDVVIIPVRRDELLPALVDGRGDIAAANLTITPERSETVDFSIPLGSGVSELLVTSGRTPEADSTDDLSGMEIHARPSSSYWESLEELNRRFVDRGLVPAKLVAAPEFLEDEDLLEMVNAGLIPAMIVDSHKAGLWSDIFDNITVHENVAIRTGGEIAWAFRQNSPELAQLINEFAKGHRTGSLFGNVLLKRYFENNTWVRNNLADEDRERFKAMIDLFRKYGDQYDFDYLMLAALAYQESGLVQSKRSGAGAVGVMQMLPSTANDPNVGIQNINDLENNIHAGTKYLRFLRDRYFSDEAVDPVNQELLTFAAYNAGPAKIRRLRAEAAEKGLDPNVWFHNVELIAARRIGRETVSYVSNISKYHIAYQQIMAQLEYRQSHMENR